MTHEPSSTMVALHAADGSSVRLFIGPCADELPAAYVHNGVTFVHRPYGYRKQTAALGRTKYVEVVAAQCPVQ